jgi:putative aldouronate transport system permease protein
MTTNILRRQSKTNVLKGKTLKKILINWDLYLFLLPSLVLVILFAYFPMYGVQIAFKNFSAAKGIWNSQWVGVEHFIRFFKSYYFWQLIKNTLTLSVYGLILGFPLPILLALGLNELKDGVFKKTVQTVTYAPYFISTVVMCGMIIAFLNPETGIINKLIEAFGGSRVSFLTEGSKFPSVYVLSGVWQGTGWGSIIYLAALTGVDPQLHEAAIIDGATRLQRIWHINIPSIVPTMVVLLILNTGGLLSVGYEKILLLQNSLNAETSEVISTYVYKTGLVSAQYSFSTAVGLFNSAINFIILVAVNTIASHVSENSLW